MQLPDGEELLSFVGSAPIGICILDAATLLTETVNDAFQEVTCKPYAQIHGRYLWESFPGFKNLLESDLAQAAKGETIKDKALEIPVIRFGELQMIVITFVYTPLKDKSGAVNKIAVWLREDKSQPMKSGRMKALNDELANTNEELASTNEELTSINEELQVSQVNLRELNEELEMRVTDRTHEYTSMNEKLVSANEELLSTNEELSSVNQKLLQTQLALGASEKQLRFTLNAIPSQVWTADPDGALNYVNQVASDDFGYNAGEVVGHGWQKFIHPNDLDSCLKSWAAALQTGSEYMVEFRLKFADGNYYWHLARAVPFVEEGKIRLWLGTNTNIDPQKLNEYKKDEFLSIASHELKTPLTSIKLYNQLINRATDENQIKKLAAKTTDHILRLERLISDLLDVTKINAGKMTYTPEPFDFGKMVSDSVEALRYHIRQEIIIEQNVNITYTGDQFRLEQVMNNFLSNAIKYSPQAEKIIVRAVLEHHSIIVSVQDFGIGIDQESIDRLFDRYYRVDNTAMRFEGLGLGLFISSEILKRHKGSFWIESEKGEGSIFYFRLPLENEGISSPPVITPFTYHHETITINYVEHAGRIEVNWTGFQNLESVKAGCMAMLDTVRKTKCARIINDNTHVLGNWSEATEWVGNDWFPMMEKAGLKYFAHIFSPSTFSKLAAQKSIDIMAGLITTQYFTDVEAARKWIDGTYISKPKG